MRTGLLRTAFSQGALYEIGSAVTLFRVRKHDQEFLAALEGRVRETVEIEPETEELDETAAAEDEPDAERITETTGSERPQRVRS